jgi:hypothetical protein
LVEGASCRTCGQSIASPAALAAPPTRRKTSPLVWILVVLLGIAVIVGVATFAGGWFLVHKAREAGINPELFHDNPGLAISKVIGAFDPNAEVVKTDESAGTVTLRDRRSGKEINITFDDARNGRFRFQSENENGKKTVLEFGGDATNVPAEVPVYPGAKLKANFEVDGDQGSGQKGAYEYELATHDTPAKVVAYYHHKLEESGMRLAMQNSTPTGGMLVAEDDAHHRTMRVIVGRDDDDTTINITARMNH